MSVWVNKREREREAIGTNVAAIPEDATESTFFPCFLIYVNKTPVKNVFSVPPDASKEKYLTRLLLDIPDDSVEYIPLVCIQSRDVDW